MSLAAHAAPPQVPAAKPSRGELLYTLHCDTCHAEQAHWRAKRQADTPARLHQEVRRWADNAQLGWNAEDVREVARHLDLRHYHFTATDSPLKGAQNIMKLTSPAFAAHAAIPALHTCEGRDISPPLAWSDLPPGTRSLVLIVDDPDAPDPAAPKMTYVHWLLYNLPPEAGSLKQGVSERELPAGTHQGVNDWGRTGYGGPCPPIGRHRYFHKLYALDVVLPDLGKPDKARLEAAMRGHVLTQTELIGVYQKTGK